MKVSLIVAAAENGVIGRRNELPWRLSADLKRFKELTMRHAIIMGRKTFESIGRPLPGRRMIVITRHPNYQPTGAQAVGSLEAALAAAEQAGEEEAFVIGGAEIFREASPRADRLYLTRVNADVDGDVFFSLPDSNDWRLLSSAQHPADAKNDHPFTFEVYERIQR
jgi:dihydrofolate reductase